MKRIETHVCPVWEQPDGNRVPGMEFDPVHGPVVGWCCIDVLEIGGERRELLLAWEEEARARNDD